MKTLSLILIVLITLGCSGDGGDKDLSPVSIWKVGGQEIEIRSILAIPEKDPYSFAENAVDGVSVYFLSKNLECNDSIYSSDYVVVFFPEDKNEEYSAPITVEYETEGIEIESAGITRELGFQGELELVETSEGQEMQGWVRLVKLLDFEDINLTLVGTFEATYCLE